MNSYDKLKQIAEDYHNGNISDFKDEASQLSKYDLLSLIIIFIEEYNFDEKTAILRIQKYATN